MTGKVSKDRKTIGAMFSSIVPVYDFLNRLLSFGRDRAWRRELVLGADLPPDGLVLDVCTGTGDVALAFITLRPDFKGDVIGIDFSALMIDRAREKAFRFGPPCPTRAEFLMGDALDLQFPDNKFDVVSVAFGIRNFADLETGLKEILRVLKPDGQVNILEFFPSEMRNPVIRWYLDRVAPCVGNLLSRSRAYTYLRRSTDEFVSVAHLQTLMAEIGFASITAKPLTLGVAHIVRARKKVR